MDMVRLPDDMNYYEIEHLSLESRQKITLPTQLTIGQSSYML